MAGLPAQAALRGRLGELLEAPAAELVAPVVGWLKQASLEVRAAGARAAAAARGARGAAAGEGAAAGGDMADSIVLLHYNDVYNIEQTSTTEPVGGALRFVSALRAEGARAKGAGGAAGGGGDDDDGPIVLFSGDAFSPSMMSTFFLGQQMVPVLNAAGTHCAVFGNHDFDFGLEALAGLVGGCGFPWLMSNVLDRETGRPLGDGRISHLLARGARAVGLIGLVEQEWLETLATINPEEVTYIDFAEAGERLARQLKQEGCQLVVALTHMRAHNDARLAALAPGVDLILGGHDHIYDVQKVNGKLIVKSGTDFRQYSRITVTWGGGGGGGGGGGEGAPTIRVEQRDVTSHYPEDPDLKQEIEKYSAKVEGQLDQVLGRFGVELDGRFSHIRTRETNLGNWVCDVILAATQADLVILNSGTFRSDRVHGAGGFTLRALCAVVPARDPLVLLSASGDVLLAALENAVSLYPRLEGRFPQVAGVCFAFDPRRAAGRRVLAGSVRVAGEPLQPARLYRLAVKQYLHAGHDGYSALTGCPLLMDADTCPELGVCLRNYFSSVSARARPAPPSAHSQRLLTRRHSLVRWEAPPPAAPRRASLAAASRNDLCRRASLEELEQQSCELSPRVDGRIAIVDSDEKLAALQAALSRPAAGPYVIAEDDETRPD